jgi:hypothetical protein
VLAIAYMIPAQAKRTDGHVMQHYKTVIDDALAEYSPEFARQFRETTDEPPRPLMQGEYTFAPRTPTS